MMEHDGDSDDQAHLEEALVVPDLEDAAEEEQGDDVEGAAHRYSVGVLAGAVVQAGAYQHVVLFVAHVLQRI